MYFQALFIFLEVCNAALIYQKTYETTSLELTYQLSTNKQYLIQLAILSFPDEQSCLPYLSVNSTDSETMQSYTDEQGFATKAQIQQIYIQASRIAIAVFNRKLNIISDSNLSQTISFTLSIFDSPPNKLECFFPTYGTDCQQHLELIETETDTILIVPEHSWNYYYYILDNFDYYLEANCDWGQFAVAFLPLDKANNTILPSFQSKLIVLLDGQSQRLQLDRVADIKAYVFTIGVYNFESEASIKISLMQNFSETSYSFPLWAVMTIIGVCIAGLFIAIFIIYQLRKQAKIYEEKPKLTLEILNKYMPIKPVPKHQLPECCCVCLVQFLKRDQVRETPCRHFFHDKCLCDWTHKNPSCPVCRQELNEAEIQKFISISLVMSQKNEFNNSNQGSDLPKIPLTQLRISDHDINTRGIIMIDNSPSHQHSHSDRLSINLIEDQIVEN